MKPLKIKIEIIVESLFEHYQQQNSDKDIVSAIVGNDKDKINYCSIGSSCGLFEYYLPELGFQSAVACEYNKSRAHFYEEMHPGTHMVNKSIADPAAKKEIVKLCKKNNVQLMTITLPCQGASSLTGKSAAEKNIDPQNWLFLDALDVVDAVRPKWIIGENVVLYYKNIRDGKTSEQMMRERLEKIGYTVKFITLDAADYGTPQERVRRYMLAYLGDKEWKIPGPSTPQHITIRKAIGHLPVVESGQDSGILYHKASQSRVDLVKLVQHTPTGCNIKDNPTPFNIAYKKDGKTPMKYKFSGVLERNEWDRAAHTITTGSGSIMGAFCLHPGTFVGYDNRGLALYNNARPWTILECIVLSGLPESFQFPDDMSYTQMRDALGEIALPLMMKMFIEHRPVD